MPPRAWPASRSASVARALRAAVCGGTAFAALGGAFVPSRLAAQSPASAARLDAEVGAAVLSQPGVPALTAPTLGGSWARDGARTALRADAALAAGASAWSGQLVASAAHFVGDPDAPFEFDARARVAHVPAARATTQLVAGVRRHVSAGAPFRPSGGAWAGALGGVTTGVGAGGAAPLVGVEAGAWRALASGARVLAAAVWTTTRVDSAALAPAIPALAPGALRSGASRVRTLDATAGVERAGARVEVSGAAGARLTILPSSIGDATGRRWGALAIGAVTWWLRPGVGLVAGAGTQPGDPSRGLPGVRHVALTLRLRPRAWTAAAAGRRAANPLGAATRAPDAPFTTAVRAVAAPDGGRVLRVSAAGARRVQLRAAATAWRPVELTRAADGDWVVTLAWPAGAHRVAVRVNEGEWRAPGNLPALDDEFGGRVGLLVVP